MASCRCERAVDRLRAKLASARGETLVETLVATLIMGLVMLMLCTAIVSAAKINTMAKANDITFNQGEAMPLTDSTTVTITDSHGEQETLSVSGTSIRIDAYTQNGFVYYEPHKNN